MCGAHVSCRGWNENKSIALSQGQVKNTQVSRTDQSKSNEACENITKMQGSAKRALLERLWDTKEGEL